MHALASQRTGTDELVAPVNHVGQQSNRLNATVIKINKRQRGLLSVSRNASQGTGSVSKPETEGTIYVSR
jgi:hypothetical protein